MSFNSVQGTDARVAAHGGFAGPNPHLVLKWSVAALGLLVLGWAVSAASGATFEAPEQCRRSVVAAGYYREPIDWDAPAAVREEIDIANYVRKKAYQRLLESCEHAIGPPTITCGPLKCGGVFSTVTESTVQQMAREQDARNAQRVEVQARRQAEDQIRHERMQREDQEKMFKRLKERR